MQIEALVPHPLAAQCQLANLILPYLLFTHVNVVRRVGARRSEERGWARARGRGSGRRAAADFSTLSHNISGTGKYTLQFYTLVSRHAIRCSFTSLFICKCCRFLIHMEPRSPHHSIRSACILYFFCEIAVLNLNCFARRLNCLFVEMGTLGEHIKSTVVAAATVDYIKVKIFYCAIVSICH